MKKSPHRPASCNLCRHFVPDTVGDGYGLGRCGPLEDYKARGASPDAVDYKFRTELGNRVFYRGTDPTLDRRCTKFEPITTDPVSIRAGPTGRKAPVIPFAQREAHS